MTKGDIQVTHRNDSGWVNVREGDDGTLLGARDEGSCAEARGARPRARPASSTTSTTSTGRSPGARATATIPPTAPVGRRRASRHLVGGDRSGWSTSPCGCSRPSKSTTCTFTWCTRRTEGGSATRRSARRRARRSPADEIVKAYELDSGKLVYLEDPDFEAAQSRGLPRRWTSTTSCRTSRSTRSTSSARTTSGRRPRAEKVYALLARRDGGVRARRVVTFVMRESEYLGCLRVRDGVLELERMFFADEIRGVDDVEPKARGRTRSSRTALDSSSGSRATSTRPTTRTRTATP